MKHLIIGIVFLSISTAYSQDIGNYPDGYIPKNITDALRYLNTTWADEDKEEFRVQDEDDALAELHFEVGMSIRNSWGFWSKKKNSLVKELESYGFSHPDDKSWAILSLFHKQLNNPNFNLSEELGKCKEENRALRNIEVAFDKDIRRKYKSLSVGDTVRVPFGVMRSGNSLSLSIFSNRSGFKYDDFDCIVTGIIKKKKRNKGYPLTIEINDVWFKNEDDYGRNIRKNIGDVFVHEMKYFVIITDKLLSE